MREFGKEILKPLNFAFVGGKYKMQENNST